MAHSLAQKLLGYESASECYFPSPPQCDWLSKGFQCNLSDTFAEFKDEFRCFGVPRSANFYGIGMKWCVVAMLLYFVILLVAALFAAAPAFSAVSLWDAA